MFELLETIKGGKAVYKTTLDISLINNKLKFTFVAEHCSFNSYSDKYNDNLYDADAVEIFITRKEQYHYYEIELAPNGTLFVGDIYNDGKTRVLTLLDNIGIEQKTKREGDTLIASIIFDLNKIKDIPEDCKFNAFRIDTDGIKTNAHLFALSPTYKAAFHHPEVFVKLKDYLK